MAGVIVVGPDEHWSAASWLFDWVIRYLATTVQDAAAARMLEEIEREHLPGLTIGDLPDAARRGVSAALRHSIVDHAARSLPLELANRNGVLSHLQKLADLACQAEPSFGSG